MSISGEVLYNKIRSLRPDVLNSVTSDILNKICNESCVQPFLKWFCENVSHANVLNNEELRIKEVLQKTGEWLEGAELDQALDEVTQDCPELLKLTTFDAADTEDLFAEYEILKELYKEDKSYSGMLKDSLQNLKNIENQLDEDIEVEETQLEKETISANKAYNDCSLTLNEFDKSNREFFRDVDNLLNVYADAVENKKTPILWTQMPLEIYVKKVEMYNHYLDMHIRRHFGIIVKEEQEMDSDYVSLINDTKENHMEKKIQELILCRMNITNSKIEKITAKGNEESCIAMLEYIQDIYNKGNIKVPRHSELQTEIMELTKKRDFLEETVNFLREHRLTEVVEQYAELETAKILKYDAEARIHRRRRRFEILRDLRLLAREHGHAHTDLLCMLMDMQFHCLKEISEFVADAQHYLATEYLLSSTRCKSMERQQNEYRELLESSEKAYNSFDKCFISMVCGNDVPSSLSLALDKYNEIVGHNKDKKRMILETCLNSKVMKLQRIDNEASSQYANEIQKGPTHNFKPVSHEVGTSHDKAITELQEIQTDLTKIRGIMKDRIRIEDGLKREKDLLWQRFLADPDTLRKTYIETKEMVNKFHFGNTVETK